jgi:hypothetical protein
MITTAMLLYALTCPTTKVNNMTNVWDAKDKASFNRATKVCKDTYGPKGKPCLITFTKLRDVNGSRDYQAICGYKRNQ